MKKVGTAHLKNNLSLYLNEVRAGAELVVTDRGKPIAKIVPLNKVEAKSIEERLVELVEDGFVEYSFSRAKGKKRMKRKRLKALVASELVVHSRND